MDTPTLSRHGARNDNDEFWCLAVSLQKCGGFEHG